MGIREWSGGPRRVLALFLVMTIVPGAALAWLGWSLLEQDRALENQRVQGKLELVADRAVSILERALDDLQPLLIGTTEIPDGVIELSGGHDSLTARPESRLLYYPVLPASQEAPYSVFADGDRLEFREQNLSEAAAMYQRLADATDPSIRSEALVRQARVLRKLGRQDEALLVYGQLAEMKDATIRGLPAAVVAMAGRCSVWEESGNDVQLRQEAEKLRGELLDGRNLMLRASFDYQMQEANRWAKAVASPDPVSLSLSEAATWVWKQWKAEPDSSGSRFITLGSRTVAMAWRGDGEKFRGVVAGAPYLRSALDGAPELSSAEIALADSAGNAVLGQIPDSSGPRVVRAAAGSQLPWTIYVSPRDLAEELAGLQMRRRMLLAGFALTVILLGVGSYFVLRSVSRELAVARVQSDFVAAVSHEFRSPLTSMRQLSDLLSKGRVRTDEQRSKAYDVLVRESGRLHRLVEDLLDFGRMEAGAAPYQFTEMGAEDLVNEVVTEFGEEAASRGYTVELSNNVNGVLVQADREALGRALWNLLDNAVKYSPDCKTVWVTTNTEAGRLAVRIRDEGAGIARSEQAEVFKKFVRGSATKAAAIKGTGLGLAMVDHIVRAHGGEVRLESEPGKGSTFTVLLPPEDKA